MKLSEITKDFKIPPIPKKKIMNQPKIDTTGRPPMKKRMFISNESMEKINAIQFGGSGIERITFEWICEHIPQGSTVIELGAGNVSTPALSEVFNLISVEHNEDWCGIHEKAHYIYAPVSPSNWYDVAPLQNLPNHAFVLIDGHCREGILNNLDLFDSRANFMIHDTYREGMRRLAHELAERLERNYIINTVGDHFAWI